MVVLQAVEYLLLGIVTYRAGIEQDGISQLGVLREVEAVHLHDGGDDLAIGDVHLTAIGLDVDALDHWGRCGFRVRCLSFCHSVF